MGTLLNPMVHQQFPIFLAIRFRRTHISLNSFDVFPQPSQDGVVMILSQDADGMPFYLKQQWCVGEGQRLAWTKAWSMQRRVQFKKRLCLNVGRGQERTDVR